MFNCYAKSGRSIVTKGHSFINIMAHVTAKPSRLQRYGLSLNTHDLVKIVAILLMVIDHIGYYLLADNLWFRLIGRNAAPLFFFLIGYSGKLHITWMLCLYGVLLTLSAYVVNGNTQIDILLGFILLPVFFHYLPAQKLAFIQRMSLYLVCATLTLFLYKYIEYGLLGILIGYSGRFVALNEKYADLWLILALIIYYLWESLSFGFTANPSMLYWFGFFILMLYLVMSHYQQKTLSCPKWLLMPSLVVSRYSLEVYFFHLIALQAYKFLRLS